MHSPWPLARRVLGSAGLLALASCGGGGGAAVSGAGPGPTFAVVRTDPPNAGSAYLNDPIRIDFTSEVDLATADLASVAFAVFAAGGTPLDEAVTGEFKLAAASGDAGTGRRLELVPHFPTDAAYAEGGFRPGRRYVVSIRGGAHGGSLLRDQQGKALQEIVTFEFTTVTGTTAHELFRDTLPGGPRRKALVVTPTGANGESGLSLLGQVPVEVRLTFDQPLHPARVNVPVGFDPDPARRDIQQRGRIWLEYDDPDPARGKSTWIPTTARLAENSPSGATVVLRPVGVLPNAATVRAIVLPELEDLSGESNAGNAAYDRVFGSFATSASYEPQFDAVVERFATGASVDPDACFVEPRAEVGAGYVKASFDFEGSATARNYRPTQREVVLNTDFTQVVPEGSEPINVSGGVFQFDNVEIPAGVTVKGAGSRPMVWLVAGDFTVAGELTVSGGDGTSLTMIGQYRGPGDVSVPGLGGGGSGFRIPNPGGIGVCGGGNGGKGCANPSGPTYPETEAGYASGQVAGGGGQGGKLSCVSGCGRGSGGGGGALATQGDPSFKVKKGAGTSFVQQIGQGGYGCTGASAAASRNLAGGQAGVLPFSDTRGDNNFWGSGIDLRRQIRIQGELAKPIGGAGGGGGGDLSSSSICTANATTNPNWISDSRGGAGGGGGGVLIVKALGSIVVKSTGVIRADGGNGSGGMRNASNSDAGGGGGGSGGMVVLMAGRRIQIEEHGETYANNDYTFAISADGGVSKKSNYVGAAIASKYAAIYPATTWDESPTGGFGGMGIVQLMAPAGDNSADGTNTVLDDNIEILKNGLPVSGTEKRRYLAWRGFPNAAGTPVDDAGNPTHIGDAEGDIRPAPILLPAPFGALSRVRSRWLDTGASVRRELTSGDGQARGVVPRTVGGTTFGGGPAYSFGGTFTEQSPRRGYVAYEAIGSTVQMTFPVPAELQPVMPAEVEVASSAASFAGKPAYEVVLQQPVLGPLADRWSQHRCELLDPASGKLAEFRILAHDERTLWLAPEGAWFPAAGALARVRIVARYFDLVTDRAAGFGGVVMQGTKPVPATNVRIGFAFHRDPSQALASGVDPGRYPQAVGTFAFDLADPAAIAAMRDKPFVQWDTLFNTLYSEQPGNLRPESVKPGGPLPEIRSIVVPYRY